jgi:hypothetical protein
MASKPRLFIGSSSSAEGLDTANAIQENLKRNAEVTIWSQGVFELSKTTIESLIEILDSSDFGVFVFTLDDVLTLRGKKYSSVRDNVLFELGLFIGKLGRERTFIVIPDNAQSKNLRIPTDLLGITLGTFENNRQDKNLISATSSFSTQVKTAMSRLGKLKEEYIEDIPEEQIKVNTTDLTASSADSSSTDYAKAFNNNKFDDAISAINILLPNASGEEKIILENNLIRCNFRKQGRNAPSEFQEYLSKNNDNPQAYKHVALSLSAEFYYVDANKVLDEGEVRFKDNSDIRIARSMIFHRTDRIHEAIDLLQDVEAKTPELSIILSDYLHEIGDKNTARNVIHRALIQTPYENEEILQKLAYFSLETDHYSLALYISQRIVHDYPQNPIYIGYLANACRKLGLNDHAYKNYIKAIGEGAIKEPTQYGNLGSLYRAKGLYSLAKDSLAKAMELDSSSAFFHIQMAETLRNQEEDEQNYQKYVRTGRLEAITEPQDHNSEETELHIESV